MFDVKKVRYRDLLKPGVSDINEELVPANAFDREIIAEYEGLKPPEGLAGRILLREGVAARLGRVNARLMADNPHLRLKVTYGYRPYREQCRLFEHVLGRLKLSGRRFPNLVELHEEAHRYIAAPWVSGHPTGGAVDLTIFDRKRNRNLDMASPIDDITANDKMAWAHRGLTPDQRENRGLLLRLMTSEGFAPFWGEWWHFSFGDQEWAYYHGEPKAVYKHVEYSSTLGRIVAKPTFAKTFLPGESILFQRMLDTLRASFETYGFIPHSTPSLCDAAEMVKQTGKKAAYLVEDPTGVLTGLGLRQDHTVPLINFVNEQAENLHFPFRRYTTQKNWRPGQANGLFEFHACDLDVVGLSPLPLIHDVEVLCAMNFALEKLQGLLNQGLKFKIHLNNRKLVNGFLKAIKVEDQDEVRVLLHDALHSGSLDKDKLGEYLDRDQLQACLALAEASQAGGNALEILAQYESDPELAQGLEEVRYVADMAARLGVPQERLKINPILTRDLNYYTGTICRTFVEDYPQIGSICHGGRYAMPDTGKVADYEGVGVTFPLTDFFMGLARHNLMDTRRSTIAPILVSSIYSYEHAIQIAAALREEGVGAELFLDNGKTLAEQMAHAKKRGFYYMVWTEDGESKTLGSNDIIKCQDLTLSSGAENYRAVGFFKSMAFHVQLKRKSEKWS